MRLLAAILALALSAAAAQAVEPNEILKDPALEQRARAISKKLRCLVCQNQSIDDSDAGLARDLRVLVRERLSAGDSDAAVLAFVTARYGDFVLLRPPFKPTTYALWLGPAAILLAGSAGAALYLRRRGRSEAATAAAPLSEAERRRLARLVDEGREP